MTQDTCSWKSCRSNLAHYTLAGPLGKSRLVGLCAWHFRVLDAANRIPFWRRERAPNIRAMHVDDDVSVDAAYDMKANSIYVTQRFAENSPELMVYVLSHETLHWWICKTYGLLTSMCLDLIYKRPLHCLGHQSMQTYELTQLGLFRRPGGVRVRSYRRTPTEGLNTPSA